jgi:Family of unknown function (DUF5691)
VTLARWEQVLAAALVGTDRRPLPDLLDAAAAHGLRRRAGVRPATGVAPPIPAPAESMPMACGPAIGRLAFLLDDTAGGYGRDAKTRLALIEEWLDAGRRVPGELLPALLDLGRRHRSLRPGLVGGGGARAGWLAAQRPEWAYLLGQADETTLTEPWDLAPVGRRIGHLSALRQRDPAAARDLLIGTWDTESAQDRAALLGTFAVGLSTADEALLERALDDRRREVRIVAADLLPRLPDSGYGRRMAARAVGCLRPSRDGVRVDPPAQCDQQMRRDGVDAKPPAGVGSRAWWLEELLARTPLATWTPLLGPDPPAVLALPMGDWAGVVRRGLARAAAAQGNAEWAVALVDLLWPRATAQRPGDRLLLESLYETLAPAQRAGRAVAVLRSDPKRASAAGVERLLELCPRPWPPALAGAVLAAIDVAVRAGAPSGRLTALCTLAATRLPVSAVSAVSAVDTVEALRDRLATERPDDSRLPVIELLANTLRFRQSMIEELQRR